MRYLGEEVKVGKGMDVGDLGRNKWGKILLWAGWCTRWCPGSLLSNAMSPCFKNHRITESQNRRGCKGPLRVQPPCWSRVTYSRPHRTTSRQVVNICREGESTASLGSLFQCSVTLRGKKFFLMFSWSFLCFNLCPLPLVLSLGTTEKSLAPSSWHPPFRYL